MSEINLKLKSYDELIFEITTLNTNKYLLEQKVNKQKEILGKIKELTLQRKHCEDLFGGKQKTINDKILELLEEIE